LIDHLKKHPKKVKKKLWDQKKKEEKRGKGIRKGKKNYLERAQKLLFSVVLKTI